MKLIEKVRETAKVLKTLSRKPKRQPPKRLQARVRATTTATVDDYEEEEPQTKLTSAFVVVLILHIVAVGGIYAFNEIKASRKGGDTVRAADAAKVAHSSAATPASPESDATPSETSASAAITTTTTTVPATATATSNAKPRTYTVKSGDTLHGIAKANGMGVVDLKAANALATDSIRPGQVLTLASIKAAPVSHADVVTEKTETADPKAASKTYTVKSGDRLIFIAKRFNVTQEELIAANKIKDPTKLQIGQMLKIPTKK